MSESVTHSSHWAHGTSDTRTTSGGRTLGASQFLVPLLREVPGAYWPLDQLLYMVEVALSHQPAGTFTVRNGFDTPVRTASLFVPLGHATEEHVEFVSELLHERWHCAQEVEAVLPPPSEVKVDVMREVETALQRTLEPEPEAEVHTSEKWLG